jgi:hypothetical protein
VRQTAERVQETAKESRRLTEIARQQSERRRTLAKARREEAGAVGTSVRQAIDDGGKAKRRPSGKTKA